MKKLLFVLVIMSLFTPSALADNKSIPLNKKKLIEVESLLKSHGFNVSVIQGDKIFLKNDKDGYTSSIILLLRNLDNQKEGVYYLHYKKTKLIKILWLEQNGVRTTGEKIISTHKEHIGPLTTTDFTTHCLLAHCLLLTKEEPWESGSRHT